MNQRILSVFLTALLFFAGSTGVRAEDSVRIRTFAAMEPYGRMNVTDWDSPGQVERWNTAYGFTPGLEVYGILGPVFELGGGVRYQVPRRIFRDGGSDDEKFSYIPIYMAGRFFMVNSVGMDLYAIVRVGYTFFTASDGFKDVWIDEAGGVPLESVSGGFYGGASIGVILTILQRENWGLDWSMDAGYAYHGGSGKNTNGKGFAINYQVLSVDFSLDWRF